jgi:hypothetical protein
MSVWADSRLTSALTLARFKGRLTERCLGLGLGGNGMV